MSFSSFKEKSEEKTEKLQTHLPKKITKNRDWEEVEVKLLSVSDFDAVYPVLQKCLFAAEPDEVKEALSKNLSFGAYVDRILVAVGLAWPINFDPETMDFYNSEPNAVFLEDDAVLLQYEGKGLRKLLIEKREEKAKNSGFKYSVTILEVPDTSSGEDINTIFSKRGNKTEKLLLSMGYKFIKQEDRIIAFKQI